MLLAQPLDQPRRRRLEPRQPALAPVRTPERRVGWHRVHRDLADRVLAQLAERDAAADVVDVGQVAVVGALDRHDRPQVRRPQLGDLDRGERPVADPPHPDRPGAPRLCRQPLDRVEPVERLRLRVLVERDAAGRAGPAHVDPAQGVPALARGTCRGRCPRCGASCPCRTGSSRGSPGTGPGRRGRPGAATGSPTARSRRERGSGRPRPSRPRARAGSPGVRSSRRRWPSAGVYGPAPATGRERPPHATMPRMDDATRTPHDRRPAGRQRSVDPPLPPRRLREPVDHDLARRGHPAGRRAGHLRRRPLRQPRGRRPRPRRRGPGPARRPAPLRARRVRVGDPGGRRARGETALEGARRELRRGDRGDATDWRSWPGSTSPTASRTSSRSCSSRPA